MNSALIQFLGVKRWHELYRALVVEWQVCPIPLLSTTAIAAACLVGFAPFLVIWFATLNPHAPRNMPLIIMGICTLLAILIKWRLKLSYQPVIDWKEALSLTHTAFALGCIPAIIIVILAPEHFLAQREILAGSMTSASSTQSSPQTGLLSMLPLLLLTALWAAVTEEIIYRGLLVSVLRRSTFLTTQSGRNFMACGVSSILFGAAHVSTWGIPASIALVGVGFGFSIGYLANGEKLTPLILYHFAFDILSIAAGLLSMS